MGRASSRKKKSAQQKRDLRQLAVKAAQSPPAPPEPPSGLTHNYGPGVLSAYGPLIVASWRVPQAVEDFLLSRGEEVPAPVTGALLLDTGATFTCISIKAADALGLKETRMAAGLGAGGDTLNPVFSAKLQIAMLSPDGSSRTLLWELEAQGIPKLNEHFRGAYSGQPMELIGLLGRDILSKTRFLYDGIAGHLALDFDLKAMNLA